MLEILPIMSIGRVHILPRQTISKQKIEAVWANLHFMLLASWLLSHPTRWKTQVWQQIRMQPSVQEAAQFKRWFRDPVKGRLSLLSYLENHSFFSFTFSRKIILANFGQQILWLALLGWHSVQTTTGKDQLFNESDFFWSIAIPSVLALLYSPKAGNHGINDLLE